MIDPTDWMIHAAYMRTDGSSIDVDYITGPLFGDKTFTRSDGPLFSRLYERLTKASRRREPAELWDDEFIGFLDQTDLEKAYRCGVKETLEALRKELS